MYYVDMPYVVFLAYQRRAQAKAITERNRRARGEFDAAIADAKKRGL